MTRAVSVHRKTVSIITSMMPRNPCSAGESDEDAECAIGEVPAPASLLISPRITPVRTLFETKNPPIPPMAPRHSKAELIIFLNAFVILSALNISAAKERMQKRMLIKGTILFVAEEILLSPPEDTAIISKAQIVPVMIGLIESISLQTPTIAFT